MRRRVSVVSLKEATLFFPSEWMILILISGCSKRMECRSMRKLLAGKEALLKSIEFMELQTIEALSAIGEFLIKLFVTHNSCHYWCFKAANAIMSQFECELCLNKSILRPKMVSIHICIDSLFESNVRQVAIFIFALNILAQYKRSGNDFLNGGENKQKNEIFHYNGNPVSSIFTIYECILCTTLCSVRNKFIFFFSRIFT